jgi:hypothetical protein
MANENIMRPSMELTNTLQNGDTSLCVRNVSFSNNVHGAKEKQPASHLFFTLLVQNQKTLRRWNGN